MKLDLGKRKLAIQALISLVLAIPIGGFVFGFFACSDCGWNIGGRIFIGIVFALMTSIFLGFPPQNEGGVGEPFNVWPYIGVVAIIIFVVLNYRRKTPTLNNSQD